VPVCDFVLVDDIPSLEGFPNRSVRERLRQAIRRFKILSRKTYNTSRKYGMHTSSQEKTNISYKRRMPNNIEHPLFNKSATSSSAKNGDSHSNNNMNRRFSKIEATSVSSFRQRKQSVLSNIFNPNN
jgi:hypothetical protein